MYDRHFAHVARHLEGPEGFLRMKLIFVIRSDWGVSRCGVQNGRRGTDGTRRRPLLHCGAQSHSLAHDLGIELGNGPARAAGQGVGAGPARLMHRQLHRPSRRPSALTNPSHFKFSATVRFRIINES